MSDKGLEMSDTGSDQTKPVEQRRRRLFLHIGMHKTGTTTLQTFCATNRAALKQQGLLYPMTGQWHPPMPHHFFVAIAAAATAEMRSLLLNGYDDSRQAAIVEMSYPGLVAELIAEADAAPDLDILLSSEAFYLFDDASVAHLGGLFADFDIVPVFVVRNFADWMQSYYHSYVIDSRGTQRLEDIGWTPFNLLDVGERWAGIAAGGRTVVIDYALLQASGEPFPKAFFRCLGRTIDDDALAAERRDNASPAPMTILLCREMIRAGARAEEIAAFVAGMAGVMPAERQSYLVPDEVARLDAWYGEEIARLKVSPRVDGHFAPPTPTRTGAAVVNDLTSALLAVSRALKLSPAQG